MKRGMDRWIGAASAAMQTYRIIVSWKSIYVPTLAYGHEFDRKNETVDSSSLRLSLRDRVKSSDI